MNDLPPAIDLSAVREELLASGVRRDLADVFQQALVAQSCVVDLREADGCREALQAVLASPRKQGSPQRDSTEMALLTMAVMLYARATSTSGQKGARGSIQLTEAHLTPEQLEDHRALVDIRNRALAHVYPNEDVGGTRWHNAAVLLVWEGRGWLPAAASNRILLDRGLLTRLTRQVPIALAVVSSRAEERLNRVGQVVEQALDDPKLLAIFDRLRLDLADFFGSVEQARRALAAASDGPRTGTAWRSAGQPRIVR